MTTAEVFSYLKPGSRLGAYRVREWKGGGAYGDVYRGVKDGKPVALKLSKHRQHSADPGKTDERLLRELVCLVHVDHPHIAKVQGWARTPQGRGYLVLEYVDGWTLAHWLQNARPTFQQVARLFAKLAHALEHMHGRRVRHRDLSLSNVMVRKVDGEPVLIDLGAGEYSGAQELTDAPLPPGTNRYRSPEAARFFKENKNNPDARYPFPPEDDFYSLAVCLYDALTDVEPARGGWEARKAPRIDVNSPTWAPPSARTANPRVPEALSEWVEKWMARDFEKRLPSLASMREVLEALGAQEGAEWLAPVQAPPEAGSVGPEAPGRPPAKARRRVLAGAVAAVVLGAFAFALLREAPTREAPPVPVVPESSSGPRAQPPQALPSPPAPSASAVPSPSEMPPAVKESPSVPAPKNPSSNPPMKSAPAFSRGFLKKCAEAGALSAALLGCPAQQVQPTQQSCTTESVRSMKRLGLTDGMSPNILVDAKQPAFRSRGECEAAGRMWGGDDFAECFTLLGDGNLESEIRETIGRLPEGSRLYGRVWTEGATVVGRYTRARLPNGAEHEVCVSLSLNGGLDKLPGSKPGAALVRPTDGAIILGGAQ
ncbi:serine/threonine protein kinase [Corallococcus coralloides DSM 2259]|uniref:Serine/threonine protein kinase n=1 Tax=Corallococcus coralloides (strain ATCC 25202 / DSM 2259 / NBRC 100086 / M2) TaxID=1144275 RepID=H8MJ59_CORCM|nr:serine/threonine-protein kinase [Corallococcus coralloides]AFE09907.1 serine/threonine protein kinase [Corallococcus coralloides DSM 2259]